MESRKKRVKESGLAEKLKAKPPAECLRMDLFGDLMKFSKKNPTIFLPLRKFEVISEALVSWEREERILIYKFLCGLIITAHARRTNDVDKRKKIFEVKNRLYFSIANNLSLRRVLNFRFCVSKRFKVISYCDSCRKDNEKANIKPRDWKFCNNCEVDRSYFNVISLYHRHPQGGAALFLGKELLAQLARMKPMKHVDLEEIKEQFTFGRYRLSPRNLNLVDLESALACSEKLLKLTENQEIKPGNPRDMADHRPTVTTTRRPLRSRSESEAGWGR